MARKLPHPPAKRGKAKPKGKPPVKAMPPMPMQAGMAGGAPMPPPGSASARPNPFARKGA
jgi:hypothetical protein